MKLKILNYKEGLDFKSLGGEVFEYLVIYWYDIDIYLRKRKE